MKKGFTLIELLSVIVILATISMIVFPSITAIIKNSKESLYKTQVSNIETSAKKWATKNSDKLDINHLNATYINLTLLKKTGFLSADKVKNPLNSEYMDGCVEIKYNEENNQYTYKYYDIYDIAELVGSTSHTIVSYCHELTGSSSNYHGYIVTDTTDVPVNVLKPAGQQIIESNTTGLVEEDLEYVFKGTNVNNYVKIGTDTWRIMSINKTDYSMKLIKNNYITSSWCDGTDYLCNTDVFSDLTKSKVGNSILENIDLTFNKTVEDNDLKVGLIDDVNLSYAAIKSVENSKLQTSNIGLINISDFRNSYDAGVSYLATLFSDKNVWTISNNTALNKWIINNGTVLIHTPVSTDITYVAFPVIVVKPSLYIISGTGTSSNTFVLN